MTLRVTPRALAVASVLIAPLTWADAQQRGRRPGCNDPEDIAGIVSSSNGVVNR